MKNHHLNAPADRVNSLTVRAGSASGIQGQPIGIDEDNEELGAVDASVPTRAEAEMTGVCITSNTDRRFPSCLLRSSKKT